ncbi:MAG: [FeFe] hydrogenase H-cluster radical SAM maturase HydE [Ruminococcus sp.]|nr:[FeFe] hydrogenase H-cluster radical SAM maturase HydE [Ruminococcus sp.]
MIELVEKLYDGGRPSDAELAALIASEDEKASERLAELADKVRRKYYGDKVFLRGLIEISSYCRNDCLYCGIRRSNKSAERYRLTPEEILNCAENGYALGFRTFVMQGGEDAYFTDDVICGIISRLRKRFPDCAITLSLGERSRESYRRMKEAGADRYLLRHEAASRELYSRLHPAEMSLDNRKKCLFDLRGLGYQTGAGFMVGAPFQRVEDIVADIRFMEQLRPHMIGIGPFIPQHDTPFGGEKGGTLRLTLRILGILRLIFPKVLLPATTALGTISPEGRKLGLKTGCNVIMPNLSPADVREKYKLYDNKLITGGEAAEGLALLKKEISEAGYTAVEERGDCVS